MRDYTRGTLPKPIPTKTTHWGWKLIGVTLVIFVLFWVSAWIAVELAT